MIKYVPFLKYKSNEIIALAELEPDVLSSITPFFDYPRPKEPVGPVDYANSVDRLARSVGKHIAHISEVYLDNYDLLEDFSVGDKHSYRYLLESISALHVIPVVSIDRSEGHIASIIAMKNDGMLMSNILAIRLTPGDFESYSAISDEMVECLGGVMSHFEVVDLIFDCRLCAKLDVETISRQVASFARQFKNDYQVRRTVVTGSSIPASVSDVLTVDTECLLERKELSIFRSCRNKGGDLDFLYGDYTTISPNYSDVTMVPELMQNVITAKLIYSLDEYHYFIRGGALKAKGAGQYFDLAHVLCSKDFFRGEEYSSGDAYFKQKSRREGSNCAPGTIVKPSVNAHISFIVKDATL